MNNKIIFFLFIPLYGHVLPLIDVVNKISKKDYQLYCFTDRRFDVFFDENDMNIIYYPEEFVANFRHRQLDEFKDKLTSYYSLNYASDNIEWSAVVSKRLYEYAYEFVGNYVERYNPQVIIYDSLAQWGGLIAKEFRIHSVSIEVATDIEDINYIYEKFYKKVVLEEIRLDQKYGKIKNDLLAGANTWSEFSDYYNKVRKYVYKNFKGLMECGDTWRIVPERTFVYNSKSLYEAYSTNLKVDFCGYSDKILDTLSLSEKQGIYLSRGTSMDYYSKNILKNILRGVKDIQLSIDVTVGNNDYFAKTLINNYEYAGNIHIYNFVNQWEMLANHELFITHGGLSGVRESILCETPMIIYPSNYHDYQIGLAVEKSNIGIMINDRNLSHGYSKQLKDSIYKILS